jgi:two-component system, response regulator RegA
MSPGPLSSAPTLHITDDDEAFRTRLGKAMVQRGFLVELFSNAEEVMASDAESPEYALVDLKMPGASGLELISWMTQRDASTRVVVLTGYGSISTAVEAMRRGAVSYLPKPAEADEIWRALRGETTASAGHFETASLARAEWEYIQRVLAECGENISEAARRLNIHRRSLQRKLQKYPPAH